MRALKGAIPRGYQDHRRTDARHYRAYCEAVQTQWGPVPEVAMTTLREAGRVTVELERVSVELEAAVSRRRRRDVSRLRRQGFALREQLARLERRLEEMAASRPRAATFADALRAGGRPRSL